MKKIAMALLLLLTFTAQTVWALDEEKVAVQVKKKFEKEFPGALLPQWEKLEENGLYVVRFIYNNQSIMTYIDEGGAIRGTVRIISREYLPVTVNQVVDNRYQGFTIQKIEELVIGSDISYVFAMENDRHKILVRIYTGGLHYVLQKEKKRTGTKR